MNLSGERCIIFCKFWTQDKDQAAHHKEGCQHGPDHGGDTEKFPGGPRTAGKKQGRVEKIVDYAFSARPEIITGEIAFLKTVTADDYEKNREQGGENGRRVHNNLPNLNK